MFPPLYNPYMPTSTFPYYTSPYLPNHSPLPILTTPAPTLDSCAQSSLVATSARHLDKAWYLDSGDTNHFAHGTPTVCGTQPYLDSGKVQVANGTFLDISRDGTSVINTSSQPLSLHNLLYTPKITTTSL